MRCGAQTEACVEGWIRRAVNGRTDVLLAAFYTADLCVKMVVCTLQAQLQSTIHKTRGENKDRFTIIGERN